MRFDVALMALVCFVMSMSCGPGANVLRAINDDSEVSLDVAIVNSSNIYAGLLHECGFDVLDEGSLFDVASLQESVSVGGSMIRVE